MEAALLNVCSPGDEIITVNAGAFGERWKAIADRIGLTAKEIVCDWGTSPSDEVIADTFRKNPKARAFCIQQCETSTTVQHPLEKILPAVKKIRPDIITIVDGISAFATAPMPGDDRTIDVYVAGSQKGLMLPPGLSVVVLSEFAWAAVSKNSPRTLYFDLSTERRSLEKGETAWTPATTLILGLNAAIKRLEAEGLDKVYERHRKMSEICRSGLQNFGLKLLSAEHPSPGVTGFLPPDGIDADKLRGTLLSKFGMRLAGGQKGWKGRVLRIGHMGCLDETDAWSCIRAIEAALKQ